MNLRKATYSATRWTTASALLRALIQLLQTAILARLLPPADFGLMAMAGVVLAIALLFSDFGLSSALMHFQRPKHATLSSLYWLNLMMALGLAVVFLFAGGLLAVAYGQPSLVAICCWLSLSFPLNAFGQQFRVLAEKDLHFKPLAENEVASASTGFLIAIFLAKLNFGVYALVGAQLATVAMSSALAWVRISEGLRPTFGFKWSLTKPFLSFGLHRIGDSFWNALLLQTDVFFAGLTGSPHSLAIYATPREQSLKIATLIINPVITRVGLPVMTRLNEDRSALSEIYAKTLRLSASFNFPIYAFLAVFSDQFVLVLLGPQWGEAAEFLRIFALWGLIRSTGNPTGILLYAVGKAKRAHIWNIIQFFASAPVLFAVSQRGDLRALALSMTVWQGLIFFLAWRFLVLPSCGLSFQKYYTNFLPPLASTLFASISAYLVVQIVQTTWQLPLGVACFGFTYLFASWRLNQPWLLAMQELTTPILNRLYRVRR